ncbi:flagellar protein FliT [Zobellella maritima]|uniref:flagellar protein FliT n=1 Tax=Zobellella maritima TaxID=2059725 RepID=UPI0013006707|nr:flagellar protein FliT [Zobellella maritima]
MATEQNADASIQEDIIACYQSLLDCSARMLYQARDEDWTSLIDEESRYVSQVERLARLEAVQVLAPAQMARKAELLGLILSQDREIRARLMQRKEELGRLIGESQRQRKLNRAYSSSNTSL